MEFENFFERGPKENQKEDDPYGLRETRERAQEKAPQGFRENLLYTIEQMRYDKDEFFDAASGKLKEIVEKAQGPDLARTYYNADILEQLRILAEENNWNNYEDVKINVLQERLRTLQEEGSIEYVRGGNPLKKKLKGGD